VVISILLASIIATSVLSVALTSKAMNGQNGRNDREQVAGQAVKAVSGALRNFVSGCCDVGSQYCGTASGVNQSCGDIHGPNSSNAGNNLWSFNNISLAGGNISDSMGDVYALYAGTHILCGGAGSPCPLLPSWFTSAPYNAGIQYDVDTTVAAGQGVSYTFLTGAPTYPATRVMPLVTVTVNWTEQ
jgi:hypothetical protein